MALSRYSMRTSRRTSVRTSRRTSSTTRSRISVGARFCSSVAASGPDETARGAATTTIDSLSKKSTRNLLDSTCYPKGSFNSNTWQEADRTLRWWTRQRTAESVTQCFALLERMIQEASLRHYNQRPNRSSPASRPSLDSNNLLNYVVDNWRIVSKYHKIHTLSSEEILDRVDRYARLSCAPGLDIQPNDRTYTMLMDVILHQCQPSEAPYLGEHLLYKMMKRNVQPNGVTFSLIISSWAKSGLPHAAERAESLLRELQRRNLASDNSAYGAVMDAWANSGKPEAGRRAEALLYEMDSNPDVFPTIVACSSVIRAWAGSTQEGAAEHAYKILQHMLTHYFENLQEGHNTSSQQSLKPNAYCFSAVIRAFGRQGNPHRAETVLQQMHDLYQQTGDPDFRPNEYCYSALVKSWHANRVKGAGRKADALLESMVEHADPNTIVFHEALKAWSADAAKDPQAGERAEAILRQMTELYQSGHAEVQPNAITYNLVNSVWAQRAKKDEEAAQRAQSLLNHHLQQYTTSNERHLKPTAASFHIVMNAWTMNGGPGTTDKVLALAQRQRDMAEQLGGDPSLRPGQVTYGCILKAWTQSGAPDAADQAEAVLEEMYRAGGDSARPNTICYNSVLHCLARSNRPGSAVRAQVLIDRMQTEYENGNEDVRPDFISYSALLMLWAKEKGAQSARRAEAVLQRLQDLAQATGDVTLRPDLMMFNSVLNVYSKSGDFNDCHRAEELLKQMQELYEAGMLNGKPDVISFNTVLNCWARCGRRQGSAERAAAILQRMLDIASAGVSRVRPTTVSYNTVMQAWLRSEKKEAPDRVIELFNDMQRRYEEGDKNLRPDDRSFSALIKAYTLSGFDGVVKAQSMFNEMTAKAACGGTASVNILSYIALIHSWLHYGSMEKADQMLHRMCDDKDRFFKEDQLPLEIFNDVLMGWSKSRSPLVAGPRAEAILKRMDQLHDSGGLDSRPNALTFSFLISLLCKSRSVHGAECIDYYLSRLNELYFAGGKDKGSQPNVVWYTSALLAWLQSGSPQAVSKAEAILREMNHLAGTRGFASAKPNLVTFRTYLDILLRSDVPDKAVRAREVMRMMEQYGIAPNAAVEQKLRLCLASDITRHEDDTHHKSPSV